MPSPTAITGRLPLQGAARLFTASALMLFVQLALIRWSGANLLHLSYFSNLILLASFLGIGVGFLRAARPGDLGRYAPIGLFALVLFITLFPARIESTTSQLIFFTSVNPTGLPAWVSLPLVFLVIAATMTAFGEIAGRAFKEFPALHAYRWDILGSISGTLAFTLLSFLRAPSFVWPTVVAVAFIALYGRRLPPVSRVALLAVIAMLLMESMTPGVSWSPYYKVSTRLTDNGRGVDIWVNGIPHQVARDVDLRLALEPIYGKPYERAVNKSLQDVLIIGAGSGSDVAIALRKQARHVDAVEIDPRILQIGQQVHPNHPYQDARVSTFVNDGRAFLSSTDRRYDLILFALPDSLTLVSGASQLRLESYLFTIEAMRSAREHLKPQGVFAMYNFYRQAWLVNRLAGTLDEVYGHAPCIDTEHSAVALTIGLQAADVTCVAGGTWNRATAGVVPAPASDDWPFLYLEYHGIPGFYLLIIGLILLSSALGVRAFGARFSAMTAYRDLFFMGVAFLLLETKSVTTFALLFGTTWLVNAMVFTGVLLAVLLAIETTMRRRIPISTPVTVVGLFASLAVAFAVPNDMLLGLPVPLRLVFAVALAFAPVFCANLLFTSRFREVASPTNAFAANLLGAMIGGCLEYLSLLIGYRMLLLVVAGAYVLAVLSFRRPRVAGPVTS